MREPDWSWTTPAGRVRKYRRANKIIWGAQIPVYSRVLEVGCGVGTFTEIFDVLRIELTAIDSNPDVIKVAARRVPGPIYYQAWIESFRGDTDGGYDAIVGSSVLHHLSIKVALKKTYRLLKPGSHISFAEPNLLNPQIWIERKFPRLFSYVSQTETAFNRWFIKKKLEEAGFVDVKVTPFDWLHPLTPKILILLVDRIGRILERIPVIKEFAGSLYIRGRKPTDIETNLKPYHDTIVITQNRKGKNTARRLQGLCI